eukprot:7297629-Prymnesium_polylepis.3
MPRGSARRHVGAEEGRCAVRLDNEALRINQVRELVLSALLTVTRRAASSLGENCTRARESTRAHAVRETEREGRVRGFATARCRNIDPYPSA